MKVAQPSILRSNQAGHGRTLNVHRESKGESISQNANWLATGQKPRVPAAVSRARYQQRKLKQQQAQQQAATQTPTQNPTSQQSPQNAPPSTPKTQAPKQQQPQQQQPQQSQTPAKSVSSGQATNAVDGKDLAGKFRFNDSSSDYAIEQVIKAQGFDGKPTITTDSAAFASACRASNFIAKRGVGASNQQTLNAYDQALKNGDFYVKCSGGSMHGYGMYAASVAANGGNARNGIRHAENTARSYASGRAQKVYTMTLDKSAKIGNEFTLKSQMRSDTTFLQMCRSSRMNSAYTQDVGVYAAYKGYDAYIANGGRRNGNAGTSSDYTVILNRSKVIMLDT